MRRKLVVLDILLLLALGAIAWQGRMRWNEMQLQRKNNLTVEAIPPPQSPLTPMPVLAIVSVAKYAGIAAADIFFEDRNPAVVIDPPKVEAPKEMPPLPVVYGVLGLPSGTKAIMSERAGLAGRAVRAGDTIGEFKIVVLDAQSIIFDWSGKQISRKTRDLIDRSNPAGPGDEQLAGARSTGPSMSVQQQQSAGRPVLPTTGKELGIGTERPRLDCAPGDNSPFGTVNGRYKKISESTSFRSTCSWVKIQ